MESTPRSGSEVRAKLIEVATNRYLVLLLLLVLLGLVVLGRILWIQYAEGDELRRRGDVVYTRERLEAARGNIYSDDGRLLATSLPMFRIYMDMVPMQDTNAARRRRDEEFFQSRVDSLARSLNTLFPEYTSAQWSQRLREERTAGNRYMRLSPRDISYSELLRLKSFPILREGRLRGGLIVEERYSRVTPMGDLARRTIGWQSSDGSWVGLEDFFNEALSGTAGSRIMQRAAGGVKIPVSTQEQVPPQDGMDIKTTIDVDLQDVAARALQRKLEEHNAEKGTVVVMEVATGAIKAMVNLTKNGYGGYNEQLNIAVRESTDPGSTFKLASLIALLEDGGLDLDSIVDTGDGVYRLHGHDFKDSKRGGHGEITVSQVWELSSNVGLVKLLYERYSGREEAFLDRLFAMRLNQPLDVTLRGEGDPYIRTPGSAGWSPISLGQIGIGYEVVMTPLQVLTFYNAVANNGRMVRPYLVESLWQNGRCVKEFKPVVLQPSVCSRRVLRDVRGILERVVTQGTAMNLRSTPYGIAGKTGTAQLAQDAHGYQRSGRVMYQSSFAGYFPVDEPRYSCIVVVYNPTERGYYGNVVAGPIFREIADKLYTTRREWFPRVGVGESGAVMASKGGSHRSLERALDGLDYEVRTEDGAGRWVSTHRSDAGVVELKGRQFARGLVPDVRGFPLNDALYLVENAGFRVRVQGRGSVRDVSPGPHTRLVERSAVKLEMSVP